MAIKPLIEIENIPIEMKIKVTPSRLEYAHGTVDLELQRDSKGLKIKSKPIRLQLDTFEARNSIAPASTGNSIKKYAQQGKQGAYEATATFAQQGELMLKAKIGQDVIAQTAAEALRKDYKPNVGLDFIPKTGPEINWDPGQMEISYEMDKLSFDWRINQNQFEFIPGDIEISITQQPDVIIKYVGGPLYVPPSSDPNYEPVDVKA